MSGKKYCIYVHINKINKKLYIGQTKQKPEKRWLEGLGYSHSPCFFSAIKKYSWNSFEHRILQTGLSKKQADDYEKRLIAIFKTTDARFGYNLRYGGNDTVLSKEIRKKLSKSHMGIKMSDSAKQKLSLYWLGKKRGKMSESTKKKISEAKKGYPSPCGMLGKKHSEQAKLKISLANRGSKHYNFGKHLSEETKRKISITNTGKHLKPEKYFIKVVCVETNKYYISMVEAAKDTKTYCENICSCLRGRRKTAGGYHWRYADDLCNRPY